MKKNSYYEIADRIIEQLRQGEIPWKVPYNDYTPYNPISGVRYKGVNLINLLIRQERDPRWMTYKQAQNIGAYVKKGEKGVGLTWWQFTEEVEKLDEKGNKVVDKDGIPIIETKKLERPKAMKFVVFNARQIEGLPPLEKRNIDWDPIEKAEEILKNSGAKIETVLGGYPAYAPKQDIIKMPSKEQFNSNTEYYSCILHELCHWTAHETRLNRDINHPHGSFEYAREELRAEIGSLMLACDLGIPYDFSQNVSYISSWITILEDTPMEIFSASADAEKIKDYILQYSREQEIVDNIELEDKIINSIKNDTFLRLIDEAYDKKAIDTLNEYSNIIEYIRNDSEDNIFWQRHQKPQDVEFWLQVADARNACNDTLRGLESEINIELEDKIINSIKNDTFLRLIDEAYDKKAIDTLNEYSNIIEYIRNDSEDNIFWQRHQKPQDVEFWLQVADARNACNDTLQGLANERTHEMKPEKVYLVVPYQERAEIAKLGGKWDKVVRSWYIFSDNPNINTKVFDKWKPENQPRNNVPSMTPQEEFAEVLRNLGCIVEGEHPIMDGQKHRIKTIGDKGKEQAGFYIVHSDGIPAGYAENHRTGEKVKWKSKGYFLNEQAKKAFIEQGRMQQKQREQERYLAQQEAIKRINDNIKKYKKLGEDKTTPYLSNKGIKLKAGIFTDEKEQTTIIPLYDVKDQLRSIQYINADGSKRLAKNAVYQGCFHVVGNKAIKDSRLIILAEGYATAASIDEAVEAAAINKIIDGDISCVVTINAGNMPTVAQELKNAYPDKAFIVAGDDDLAVEISQGKNPGREKAEEAAKILGCEAIFPIFAPNEQVNKKYTDFNDLKEKSMFGFPGLVKQIQDAITLNVIKIIGKVNFLEKTEQHEQKQVKKKHLVNKL